MLLVAFQPTPTTAQFVIASWDYPDEYGQGIYKIEVYENSTGSWIEATADVYPNATGVFEWNGSIAIKLKVFAAVNGSYTGIPSLGAGVYYVRHNVTVFDNLDTLVFSQQNFTYVGSGSVGTMYYYYHTVVLNFLPDYGQVYTVTVIYEIFW